MVIYLEIRIDLNFWQFNFDCIEALANPVNGLLLDTLIIKCNNTHYSNFKTNVKNIHLSNQFVFKPHPGIMGVTKYF